MKAKKIPYYLLLGILTAGASLTLGFLSMTGAMAIWPFLGVGILFFGLSVAYEGEIYLQNIKGALNKLFKREYTKRQVASEFFQKHFPDNVTDEHPGFLQDYASLLKLEERCAGEIAQLRADRRTADNRRRLRAGKKRLQAIRKSIKQSDKWFADRLFAVNDDSAPVNEYENELRQWLIEQGAEDSAKQLVRRRWLYRISLAFSGVSGVLMGLATTYLMTGALMSLPFAAALPYAALASLIIVSAVIAGTAYALLTYNSVIDMINNDTLKHWYQRIKQDLFEKPGLRSVALATTAIFLTGLAVVLTVFTAGTWWTIVKESPRLFGWMSRIPAAISKVAMPVFLGLSALVFNLENSAESLEHVDEAMESKTGQLKQLFQSLWDRLTNSWQKESFLQFINPFRFLLFISYTPIRIVFFIGHLLSIAFTSDRVPGISDFISRLVSFLQELGTDVHYFFSPGEKAHEFAANDRERLQQHQEGPGHSHHNDIPSRLLKWCFIPLFAAAALWDTVCSGKTINKDAFGESWQKIYGTSNTENTRSSPLQPTKKTLPIRVSTGWKTNIIRDQLRRAQEKDETLRQHPMAAILADPSKSDDQLLDEVKNYNVSSAKGADTSRFNGKTGLSDTESSPAAKASVNQKPAGISGANQRLFNKIQQIISVDGPVSITPPEAGI